MKTASAKVQVENPINVTDLRREAVEGRQRIYGCLPGGTVWDHGVGPIGTTIRPTIMPYSNHRTPWRTPLVCNPQRPCSDHHKRIAYSASAIGGGFSSAAPASLDKARAVSSNARMRSGAT